MQAVTKWQSCEVRAEAPVFTAMCVSHYITVFFSHLLRKLQPTSCPAFSSINGLTSSTLLSSHRSHLGPEHPLPAIPQGTLPTLTVHETGEQQSPSDVSHPFPQGSTALNKGSNAMFLTQCAFTEGRFE